MSLPSTESHLHLVSGRRPEADDAPMVLPSDSVDGIEEAWRRELPGVDPSSIGIVTRLWRIARHMERWRQNELLEHNIDRGTLDVLAELRRSGPPYRRTAGELKQGSLISSGGLSQRLDKLERAGLIVRSISSTDRRIIDVQLTDEGMQLVDSVAVDLMSRESQLVARLSEEEQEVLRDLLRKLLSQFEA